MLFYRVFLCVTLLIITYLSIRVIKYFEKKNTIATDKLTSSIDITKNKSIDVLDDMIKDCLEEYIVLYPSENQTTYITTSMEKKMIDYIAQHISERVSPILLQQLSYTYSKEFLPELIGARVYFAVTNYVLSINLGNKTDEK